MNNDRLFEIFMSGVSSGVNVVIFFAIIYYFTLFGVGIRTHFKSEF